MDEMQDTFALPPEFSAELFSPALIVDLDRVRHNVRHVLSLCGGDPDRWRVHVKTSKIPRVWAELARMGLRTFKCATTREAARLLDVLEEEGIAGDLLVAYPLLGPMLRRLGELARTHPAARVSVLCEDARLVPEIPAEVSVFVDVNPAMDRTGIPCSAPNEILAVARAAGARFRGVHYYDGHLHAPSAAEQRAAVFACYEPLLGLLDVLEREGITIEEVVTSGTSTFPHALDLEALRGRAATRHRISPGTVVYHDLRTAHEVPSLDLRPAALVFSRVVSQPAARIVTCDAGSKAIAAEAGHPVAVALGHPELNARTPNEEHLPFDVLSGSPPERGTELYLFPQHVCPTVNLAEEAVLVADGRVLDVVSVAARAHEIR